MHIVTSGRQGGKTYKMIQWLMEDEKRILIVHSWHERGRLILRYSKGDADLHRRLSKQIVLAESAKYLVRNHEAEVAVDNVDLILSRLLGIQAPVVLATATGTSYQIAEQETTNA